MRRVPRTKLRAATRSAPKQAEEDYAAEEPNVKLSRAFVVVLLLHVVAVGGIFAFSALKDHQNSSAGNKATSTNSKSGTETAGPNQSPSPSNITHKVKPGETMAGIASQHGLTVRDLEQANNLKPGTQVNAGRLLVIPDKSSVKAVPLDVQKLVESSRQNPKPPLAQNGGSTPELVTASDPGKVYVVQKGDNPAGIAKKFKVTYAELLKANNIEDPKKLQIGQKLVIPEK